jgi:hypothetical protein
VVDAETIETSILDPAKDSLVGRGEHGRVLHAQRDEIAHVEEPPVIDLTGRAPP